MTKTKRGIALAEIATIAGLVISLRLFIPAANQLEKVGAWLFITILFIHLIQQSPWTINWSRRTKIIGCLLVLPLIAWDGWSSLDERHGPNVSIQGALPVHLWEKQPGPESMTFFRHGLGFIVKVHNNLDSAAMVDLAVLEGCVQIPLLVAEGAEDMLIEGEALPKPLVMDKVYADLQQSTIQAIRASGAIRKGSAEIKGSSTGYIGVLFSLPPGSTGAISGVPRSVSTKGDCKAIKNRSSQPSIAQLLEIGPVHSGKLPRDVAPQFRDRRLKLQLHVGGQIFEQDPSTIGPLHSIAWGKWPSLSLSQMYEVPDSDYLPVAD